MIDRSGATLQLNSAVTRIQQTKTGSWTVRSATLNSRRPTEELHEEIFDLVVIAAPFQYTELSIVPSPLQLPQPIPYIELYVTIFTSPHRLCPSFFGLEAANSVPELILTTTPDSTSKQASEPPFFSLSAMTKVTNPATSQDEYAYKIFSKSRLDSAFLAALLGIEDPQTPLDEMPKSHVSWIHEKTWNSYPLLSPTTEFAPIVLSDNLYYTGGIESFISTMETSSLMGKNVAHLIATVLKRLAVPDGGR